MTYLLQNAFGRCRDGRRSAGVVGAGRGPGRLAASRISIGQIRPSHVDERSRIALIWRVSSPID